MIQEACFSEYGFLRHNPMLVLDMDKSEFAGMVNSSFSFEVFLVRKVEYYERTRIRIL